MGVAWAAGEEPEGLKKRGKRTSLGKVDWDKGEGGPGRCGGGAHTKGERFSGPGCS
jgi:hypothetical protein